MGHTQSDTQGDFIYLYHCHAMYVCHVCAYTEVLLYRQFTHKHTIPREHAHECITPHTHARTHARTHTHTHTPSHQGQGTLHLRWQGICSAGEGLVVDLCTPHGKAVAGTCVGVYSDQREVNTGESRSRHVGYNTTYCTA